MKNMIRKMINLNKRVQDTKVIIKITTVFQILQNLRTKSKTFHQTKKIHYYRLNIKNYMTIEYRIIILIIMMLIHLIIKIMITTILYNMMDKVQVIWIIISHTN